MTLKLELPQEIEERLTAQAQIRGIAVEEYAKSVLDRATKSEGVHHPMDVVRLNKVLDEFAITDRELPHLSDYAVSREGIYEDHD